MFCENCGTKADENTKFCEGCGNPFQTDEHQPQPEFQQGSYKNTQYNQPMTNHTLLRIPLSSKLPIIAGIMMSLAVVYSIVISVFIPNFGGIQWVLRNTSPGLSLLLILLYLFSILAGIMFVIYSIKSVKKNLVYITIPMFMSLLLFSYGFVIMIINTVSNNIPYYWDTFTVIIFMILQPAVMISLPILFLMAALGKIKTKIPLIIVCVLNFYGSGPVVFADWAFIYLSNEMSASNIGLLSMPLNILSTVPYLLIAIALSKKASKEYYSKPTVDIIQSYQDTQTSYANQPATVSAAIRFCGACGTEIPNSNVFCPICGAKLADQLIGTDQSQSRHTVYRNNQGFDDSSSIGFATLSFFFPLVGLILFLVWRESLPLKAKSCGKGAIIGAIVYFVIGLIGTIVNIAATNYILNLMFP